MGTPLMTMNQTSDQATNAVPWELIDRLRRALTAFIEAEERAPSLDELCKATGLAEKDILAAMRTLPFSPSSHYMRLMTDNIIIKLYQKAEEGNVPSQKLWMQLMENWVPAKAAPEEAEQNTVAGWATPRHYEMVVSTKAEQKNG